MQYLCRRKSILEFMKKLLLLLSLLCATTLSAQEVVLDTIARSNETAMDSAVISDETAEPELATVAADCVTLDRINGKYYLGDDPLTNKEYREFLRVNSPDLYQRYRTGNALWATGWTLLGVSAVGFFFGSVFLVAGLFETVVAAMFGASSHVLLTAGLITMGSSVALNLGSIPCLVFGGIYKFSTHSLYNERCERMQTTLELSLQTGQNGIGLALRF